MANFGGAQDIFELEALGLTVQSSEERPEAQSRADAPNESGDVTDTKHHGNEGGAIKDVQATYTLVSDCKKAGVASLDLSEIILGMVGETDVALTGIVVNTAAGEWPKITATGKKGIECLEQNKTFTLPAITILGIRKAQPLGVEINTGKLTSTSLTAQAEWAAERDADGEQIAWGIGGLVATSTGEAVATGTDAPALKAVSGWEVVQDGGVDKPQADWHTATLDAAIRVDAVTGYTTTTTES
jgi:hypothetical protein